jgi:hypothetical protein
MEARLPEIIAATEDKKRAESAADEHFTEFDNEAVPGCVAVTRTDTELDTFDHENGDPFVASIDADLSSFDNKPGGRRRARTGVIFDGGPLFDKEPMQLANATRFILYSNRDTLLTCSMKFLNILVGRYHQDATKR